MNPAPRHPLIMLCWLAICLLIAGAAETIREHRLKRRLGKDYEGPAND